MPLADGDREWDVVNAGGISYASYRVAGVMEELTRYQPDLFVVYTGHNEFLEERSYARLRDVPGPIKSIMSLLARTRTWEALRNLLGGPRGVESEGMSSRAILPAEVKAKLDHSAGPASYERDELRRFVDYVDGRPHGISVRWDESGEVVERLTYRQGDVTGDK